MIDIIIPTAFDPTLTYECINSIKNVVKEPEYNITVVDNGSIPRFDMDDVHIVRHENLIGFSKAMNEGIRATSGEYVLLLNNDTVIYQPEFLTSMLEVLNSEDNIGIVSPTCDFIASPNLKFPTMESRPNDVIENVGHISAVCWLLKRSTIEKIGMFDENYEVGAFEDGDYCQSILTNNMKIMLDRRIWIKHHGSRTVSKAPGYYEAFGKNHEYFNKKWGI